MISSDGLADVVETRGGGWEPASQVGRSSSSFFSFFASFPILGLQRTALTVLK